MYILTRFYDIVDRGCCLENLTHRIRITKERLEELGGDIYII